MHILHVRSGGTKKITASSIKTALNQSRTQ